MEEAAGSRNQAEQWLIYGASPLRTRIMAQRSAEVLIFQARFLLQQTGEAPGQSTNSASTFLLPEFHVRMSIPQRLWAEQAQSSEPPMEGIAGFSKQAERQLTCCGCRLPTRILEHLSVSSALSLELQTAAVIGYRSRVEWLTCFPEFPLSTQTTEWLAAVWVSYYGQQTEDKLGCVRAPQHNMVFRTLPAPVPAAGRSWVTVALSSGGKPSGDFNHD